MKKLSIPPAMSIDANASELRRRAEQRWIESGAATQSYTEADTQNLMYELQIHQIELEMQNEELQQSQMEAEARLTRVTEFFDFAPTGFLTLKRNGAIQEANLTGAVLLGMERTKLIGTRLGDFVDVESLSAFNEFLEKIFTGHAKECIDVTLVSANKELPLLAHIEAIADASGKICQIVMTDITGLKQEESTAKYIEAVIQSTGDAVITKSLNGVVNSWNPGAEAIFGYSANEMIGKSIVTLLPPDRQKEEDMILDRVRRGDKLIQFETVRLHKNGDEIDVSVTISPIHNHTGKIIGVSKIARNISERKKQVEASLRESKNEFLMAIEALQEGFLLNDQNGTIVFTNSSVEQILGLSAHQLQGLTLFDPRWQIIHEDGSNFLSEAHPVMVSLREDIEQRDVIMGIRKPSGELAWISVNSVPIEPKKNLTSVIVTVTDITERKCVEGILKDKEERLTLATFHGGVGIWDWNLQTKILLWDESMYALYQMRREDFTGNYEAWRKSLHPDDIERGEREVNAAISGKIPFNTEFRVVWPNGEIRHIKSVAKVFLDNLGNPSRMLGTNIDITERKQIEDTLQENYIELRDAKAAAEKANLAKSNFLSSMSHELRTPLNAVLGFAQLLELGTPPPTPFQKTAIDHILKSGWHLLNLIDEILDLSLIEAGRTAISQEVFALTDVLQDCQAMVESLASTGGIHITFPQPDTSFYVRADKTKLKQVMINLLSNAIKYNRADGAVIVQFMMSDKMRVRISVTDTGMGLSPEQLAQLFQPFNRLGQETGNEEGTGIGLVVTKQLIELMGGVIGVESKVGIGSEFWIELEAAHAPKFPIQAVTDSIAECDVEKPGHPLLAQRTLLCIEDNSTNLLLVEQLIACRSDLKLITAIDGYSGIQMAGIHHPDAILMDINLPDINGFDAMKILRENRATAHISVIALSANALPHDIEKGVEAGFFRYLTKPIKINEFMDAIDAALLYATENGLASKGAVS